MATRGRITLCYYEFNENLIPPYCMMTGERTDDEKTFRFFWMPLWTYLFLCLPISVVAFALSFLVGCYSRRLSIPLLTTYHLHFAIKRCVFVFFLVQHVVTIFTLQFLHPLLNPGIAAWILIYAFFSSFAIFFLSLLLVPCYKLHVVHVSDTTITFGGVHPTFIEMIRTTRGIRSRELER